MPTSVNCPTCDKLVLWSAAESPYRPFCSKRCKLIDLGEWFSENHRIGGDPADDSDGPPNDVAGPLSSPGGGTKGIN